LELRPSWPSSNASGKANSIDRTPLQLFSSPVVDEAGKVRGVITNYTSGLYLEREMDLAFDGFDRLNLPPMKIILVDPNGRWVATFEKGRMNYSPTRLEIPVLASAGEPQAGFMTKDGVVYAWQSLKDERIHNAVSWSVVLATGEAGFYADIDRLKWIADAIALILLGVLGYSILSIHHMRIAHERRLSERVHQVQEDERSRIAREIHDDLGQNLTAIKIHLSRSIGTDAAGLDDKIRDAVEMLDETYEVVRRLARELHPSLIERFGFEDSVRWKLDQLVDVLGIKYEMIVDKSVDFERLPTTSRIHVFRIIQECLSNIQKHASCTKITVLFEQKGKYLRFMVHDDGVGFEAKDEQKARSAQKASPHESSLGLRSIAERAQLIGARVQVESKLGQGTTISGLIPLVSSMSENGSRGTDWQK
jgi:signal transduction histidine kinase